MDLKQIHWEGHKKEIEDDLRIHKSRRSVMANTVDTTTERVGTITQETVETERKEMTKAEICFGALMAIGAIAGMWGVVSLLISFFTH